MKLHTKIFIGMATGVVVGWLFGANSPLDYFHGETGQHFIDFLNVIGEVFLKLLKMLVVPLIFFSLAIGIASMEDVAAIGKTGIKVMIWFVLTTAIAISIGVGLGILIQPGTYLSDADRENLLKQSSAQVEVIQSKAEEQPRTVSAIVKKNILELIPTNPVTAMAETQVLQIIVFALFFGIGITGLDPDRRKVVLHLCHGVNDIMIYLVEMVINMAPYGVFTLMASSVSKAGIGVLSALAIYFVTVLLGLATHLAFYASMAKILGGMNPFTWLSHLKEAMALAFSTSSSSATLPVTMRVNEVNVGVDKKTCSFVLPLGATINMDGTALYQGVAVVFIAQVFGYDLSAAQLLTIVLMATLASIGTASVPGAGMIMLVMVLDSVDASLVPGIALIMGVDRLLDMCRTAVNVCGDSLACLLTQKWSSGQGLPGHVNPQ